MNNVKQISVEELKSMQDQQEDFILIDVREQHEYEICHLNGQLIPLNQLPDRYKEIKRDKKIVVHCRSGGRSLHACAFLQEQGFNDVYNLAGGILAWAKKIDPNMPVY